MNSKPVISKIDRRSLAAFAVLIIFSFGMAWLVLSKANDAVKEFENLSDYRASVIKKNLGE